MVVELINNDCLIHLSKMEDNTLDLLVTSPPYYNAREYSCWKTPQDYMENMKQIFSQVFRVLKNHHYIVVNVGDVITQVGNQKASTRKLPLGAMFTMMLEEIGFVFIDDYIWDKGEPQSKRQLGNPPYPYYQYPLNCYEHILVFAKHSLDKTKLHCPICNSDKVIINGVTGYGIHSFECKNPKCSHKSPKGRGKRFSAKSILMENAKQPQNEIPSEFVKAFRRDIVRITPVIKINSKGENIIGHTAPFPREIPELAIRYFSSVGDLVMDCFLGSGTSGIVAKELGRNFIGIEKNKEYFRLARKNIHSKK